MRQWQAKIDAIFLGLVLATPLIVIPWMEAGWEVGKVFWFWTAVELWFWLRLLAAQGFLRPASPTGRLRLRLFPLSSLWLWLLFLGLESLFLGGNSFWGGWWRRQGWWFLLHLGVLASLVSTARVRRGTTIKLLGLFSGLTVVAGFLGLTNFTRLGGTLGEANSWGIFAVLATLVVFEFPKFRWLLLLFLPAAVLSQSRSAMLAFLVVGLKKFGWGLRLILIISFIALAAWFNLERGLGQRQVVWSETLALWRQGGSFFGLGLDNFQEAFSKHMAGRGLEWPYYDQPHNLILWLLVSTGSIGLGLFLGWLYLVFSAAKSGIWKSLALALLVFGLFQPWSTAVWVYFFIVMGLLMGESVKGAEKLRPEKLKSPWGLLRFGWVALLGTWTWWAVVWSTVAGYFSR